MDEAVEGETPTEENEKPENASFDGTGISKAAARELEICRVRENLKRGGLLHALLQRQRAVRPKYYGSRTSTNVLRPVYGSVQPLYRHRIQNFNYRYTPKYNYRSVAMRYPSNGRRYVRGYGGYRRY